MWSGTAKSQERMGPASTPFIVSSVYSFFCTWYIHLFYSHLFIKFRTSQDASFAVPILAANVTAAAWLQF